MAETEPVKAKVVLVEPGSMSVRWINESAAQDLEGTGLTFAAGMPLREAMPIAEQLGVPAAIAQAASDGVSRHVSTRLVGTAKGALNIATSVYLLPSGDVLVVSENAWEAADRRSPGATDRRPRRR